MSSINPFSQYLLEEVKYDKEAKSEEKAWILDEGLF
jgi:hypothetical protein